MVGMPVLLYLPTDLVLRRLIPPPAGVASEAAAGPQTVRVDTIHPEP
jgi:hypothetical protein